jgi:hypothetical protein
VGSKSTSLWPGWAPAMRRCTSRQLWPSSRTPRAPDAAPGGPPARTRYSIVPAKAMGAAPPKPEDTSLLLDNLEVRVDPQALQRGCLYTRDEFPAHTMTRITPRFMHFHAHPTQTQAHRERETR